VLAKRVKPAEVGDAYKRLLEDHGVRWDKNNAGYVSYRTNNGCLEVEAGVSGTIDPRLAENVGADTLYSWPTFNFPPPGLVAEIYRSLLGSADKRNAKGFARALDLYGKPQKRSARKVIHAFAAWHIGQGLALRVPPKSRTRVARVLNRQLLEPTERLPEDSWSGAEKVWRDVEELAPRFVRLYAMGPEPFFTGS
jgi:hypothetical protein